MEELVYIRETHEDEHGQYTVVIEGLPLTVGFRSEEECIKFCEIIMGASTFSHRLDRIVATSFQNLRRYRVPNNYSIDDQISKMRKGIGDAKTR